MKNKSVYKLPLKVSGYLDHYYEDNIILTFNNEESLLNAIQLIINHIDLNKLETEYNLNEENDSELIKALELDYEVTTIYLPYNIVDNIYKETIIEERIDINEINKILKLKKIKYHIMKNIKDELPEKGRDIIGYTSDKEKKYVFRCNCHNPNCTEWRCSITGFGLMVNIVKWEYEDVLERKNKIEKIKEKL